MSDQPVRFRAPALAEEIAADYESTGLSLRQHPMSLLRASSPCSRCVRSDQLAALSSGRFVRVAGLVTGRQRPSTAKGTLFVTLEDEGGNINLLVWPSVLEQFRQPLLSGSLLLVKGRVEIEQQVIHVIAGHVEDRSSDIQGLRLNARNFH